MALPAYPIPRQEDLRVIDPRHPARPALLVAVARRGRGNYGFNAARNSDCVDSGAVLWENHRHWPGQAMRTNDTGGNEFWGTDTSGDVLTELETDWSTGFTWMWLGEVEDVTTRTDGEIWGIGIVGSGANSLLARHSGSTHASPNRIFFRVRGNSTNADVELASSLTYPSGLLCLAGTLTGDGGTMEGFANGVSVGTASATAFSDSNFDVWYMHNRGQNNLKSLPLNGWTLAYYAWNRVLPDDVIFDLAQNPFGLFQRQQRIPWGKVPVVGGGLSIPVAMRSYRKRRIPA